MDFDSGMRSATTPDIGADEIGVTNLPTISIPIQAAITSINATLGATVTDDGGSAVTERGVVYSITSTNSDPLIGGSDVMKAMSAGTTGAFTVDATGLAQGTAYSFKAYATNLFGTTFTNPITTFTTLTHYTEWTTANGVSGPNSGPG